MYKLTFEFPDNQRSCDEFNSFLSIVKQGKQDILDAIRNGNPIERNEQLEEHVWEDLVAVICGIKTTPSGDYKDWTIWSLHRNIPHWGTPLFGLTANEADDTIYLNLNLLEDWSDEDEMVKSIWFKCVKSFRDFEEPFEKIMSSEGINYWVKLNGKYLDVFLENVEH